jgi:serine/threonine protein kinase
MVRRMYVAIKRSKYENAKPGRRSIQIVRRRLRREAKIQGLLEHPNIARYIDFIEGAKSDLLVLEYVDGKTLFDLVRSRDVIPWKIVAGWAVALLDALDHAHGRNVIHRDIKPKNIILQKTSAGYVAKLLDMGLAKSISKAADLGDTLGAEVTQSGLIIGSAAFMAPEQWVSATDASQGSDIYSLGVTLYFAFCGQVPFEAEDAAGYCFAHTQKPPPSIRLLRPEIPVGLDVILQRMMAKAPEKRGTAGELRAAFQKLLAPESAGAKSPMPKMPKRRPVHSRLPAPAGAVPETAVLPAPTVSIPRQPAKSPPEFSPLSARVSTSTVLRLLWRTGSVSLKAVFLSRDNPEYRAKIDRAGMMQEQFGKALGRWLTELDAPLRNPIPLLLVSSILTAFVLGLMGMFGPWLGGSLGGLTIAGIIATARKLRLFRWRAVIIMLVFIGGALALVQYGL